MAAKPSLEELLEGIDPSRLSQPCKDHHLSEVALHITEWRCIAPFLRLTEVDDKEIRTKCPQELIAQNMAMLRKWREKRGHKATYQELAKVFWKLDKLSLVEEVCEILKNECSSSESEGESEQGCVGGSGSQRWTVPRYVSYMKGRYRTTRPHVLSHKLLPPPTRTVFNLALIQKERLEFGPNEELVRLLQRGQVKEAAESHTEIELSNIMTADDEVRKVILIEGAPGSGKSTLAWHICQQWEKGDLFIEYEVVVFVQLRDLELQSATSVADILPVEGADMAPDIAALLTKSGRWGRGVLLVLDGWDELQPDCPLHSLLMQLIANPTRLNMHFSSLIITSRPVTSGELQCYASSRVEVLGFKPEEVQQYFKACFGTDYLNYTRFVDQLRERPVVYASCFLPLNAVIVVHTFHACNSSLPHTLHGVFQELVLSCIMRHVTERCSTKSDITASHLQDLPSDIGEPLLALSSLAFQGIRVNKAVFSEEDFKVHKCPVDLNTTLSLVQVVESFRTRRCCKSYSFFHLQIQELLAAYHISKLEEDEQVRIFKDLFGQPRFAAVLQFYAAFTKLQAEGMMEVLGDMANRWVYSTYKTILQCIYEAQDPSLCKRFWYVSNRKNVETFSLTTHSDPLYTIALAYFLCHCCYYYTEELSVSIYGFVNIRLLLKEILKHQLQITTASPHCLTYGSLKFTLEPVEAHHRETYLQHASELLESLQLFITELVLNMKDCNEKLSINVSTYWTSLERPQLFDPVCRVESTNEPNCRLVDFICSSKHLLSLTVRYANLQILQSSLRAVGNALHTNSAIKYLTLSNCHFDLTDPARPLLYAIPLSNSLKVIDLTGTSLGGCVSPLMMGLASNTSVVELILEDCKVDLTGENGQALSNMLRTNTTLRALNLRLSRAVDLQAICVGLTFNTSLAYLDLRECKLTATAESGRALPYMLEIATAESRRALTDMLQTNTTLKSLKLDRNGGISNGRAVYLAQGLAQNRGLETMSIAGCWISTAVVELAEALKTNKCLLSLDISRNEDVGERFVHIVRSLQVNSTLRDLRASRCGIAHTAIVDIVRSSLESLDLSGNPIGDEGAEHIAQLVTKCHSLYQLNLEECVIGDRGVECLASSLEGNTSLEILHISRNEFTNTGLLALGRSLKRNKALKTLNVVKWGIPVGQKQFVLSLCENEHLTYLCLSSVSDVRDELNKVNQIRRDKNRNSLSTFE